MVRRRLIVAGAALLVAALVAVVLIAVQPTHRRTEPTLRLPLPGRSAPHGVTFGASVNLLFAAGAFSPAQIAAQLTALRRTGATIARSDAFWEASEPAPPRAGVHAFDWTYDDTIAGDLARAHLRWLAILDYTAPWAQSVAGQDHSPPDSDADFAAYARAFARRFGTGGTFWSAHPGLTALPVTTIEVWNEPDSPAFWYPRPDAGAYARLYVATRDAIDRVDTSARVLVGGLTNPTAFVPAMVSAVPALRGHVDGVAIHPYGRPAVALRRVADARAALRAAGLGSVPLYVTEFGWTVAPPEAVDYAPATRRPEYLREVLDALGHSDCGVALASLYTWVSPQSDPADGQDWYGVSPLATADGADAEGDASARDASSVAAVRAGITAARTAGPAVGGC